MTHNAHEEQATTPLSTLKGVAYALLAIVLWSGWVVVSRFGVTSSLSAFDITAIRFLVAGVLLLPFWIPHCRRYSLKHHLRSILLGFMMGAPYVAIVLSGIQHSSVAHAGIMQAASVISTYGFSYVLLNHKPKFIQVFGMMIAIGGILWILIEALEVDVNTTSTWLGHALLVIGGISWGLYITCVKAWRLPALQASTEVAVWSLFLYLPLYFLFSPTDLFAAPFSEVVLQGIYQGVLASIVGMMAFNHAIHLLGPTKASAFIPLIPALSTLLAIPLLSEHPTFIEWMGIGMISFGILLSTGILSKTKLKHWVKRHL
jgi:drug/metabolite transporter (DMT)-like permease